MAQRITKVVLLERSSTPDMDPDFEAAHSRLTNKRRMADINVNNVRVFAIELDNGALCKVSVAIDEAPSFEQTLSTALANNPDADVGNILYELTKMYTVYDIEWNGQFDDSVPITEDDEDEAKLGDVDDQDGSTPDDANPDEMQADGEDSGTVHTDERPIDLDAMEDEPQDGEEEELQGGKLEDLLKQIISQQTQDSEARKAEAEARKAEADAEKAKAIAKAMELKTQQQKEVAAMEDWESQQKEQNKRAKMAERLAKFRLAQQEGLAESAVMDDDAIDMDQRRCIKCSAGRYRAMPGEKGTVTCNSPACGHRVLTKLRRDRYDAIRRARGPVALPESKKAKKHPHADAIQRALEGYKQLQPALTEHETEALRESLSVAVDKMKNVDVSTLDERLQRLAEQLKRLAK